MNQLVRMPLTQEEPARFTAEEFMAIADTAPLRDYLGRTDLVGGIIVRMAPAHYPHFSLQRQVFLKLHELFRDCADMIVGQEINVQLSPDTVREPDVAVFSNPGPIDGLLQGQALKLVIEIGDSSLREDLSAKRLSYAEAEVPDYWVVDIQGRQTHVFGEVSDGDYSSHSVIPFGQPLPVPGADGAAITLDG